MTPSTNPSTKRPLGITLVAILFLINALTYLTGAFYSILSGTSLMLERALLLPKYFLTVLNSLSILFSLWTIALAIGLWKMRKWSWTGVLLTQVISGLIAVAVFVWRWQREGFLQSTFWDLIFSLVFIIIVLCYFLRPKTKAAFKINSGV